MRTAAAILLLSAVVSISGVGTARGGDGGRVPVTIRICSVDAPDDVRRLSAMLSSKLKMSTITLLPACGKERHDRSPAAGIQGRVESFPEGVFLILERSADDRDTPQTRRRIIPWVTDGNRIAEETLSSKKTAALALLIESLLLDFVDISLASDSPPMVPAEVSLDPREASPTQENDKVVPPPPKKTTRTRNSRGYLDIAGGMVTMTEEALAPRIQATGRIDWPRIGFFLSATFEPDSSLTIEDRPLRTLVAGARLGVQGTVHQFRRVTVALAVAAVLRYYFLKRDDLPEATVKQWTDAGIGVYLPLRILLTNRIGILFQAGMELFPGARDVTVPNDPDAKITVGRICVPTVVGLSFAF